MIKYLIIALLSINLFAIDTGSEFFSISGKSSTLYSKQNQMKTDGGNGGYVGLQLLQLNMDVDKDNWHFQATPFGYMYRTKKRAPLKNLNFREEYPEDDWWFRSLYFTYTYEKWSFGAGVLPFSNSTPTKFNGDYIEDGEGILLINDDVLTAVFGIYDTGASRTIFGIGSHEELMVDTGKYIDEHLREGSFSAFLINKHCHGEIEMVSQFLWNSIKYNDVKILDNFNLALNFSWDDSANSGWSLYGSGALSQSNSNARNAEEEIYSVLFKDNPLNMDPVEYGRLTESMSPENFAMDKGTYYGGATLLGFRKDFNIGSEEFFVNGEWTHVYGDFQSGSQGNFFTGKSNQQSSIRDNAYYIQLGYIYNNNLRIRLQYTLSEIKETGKIGAPATTIPTSQTIRPEKIEETEVYTLMVTYKF